ncbi:uncharacterized protein LOC119614503 [Lucilia sericata]|uniref:uncharacterized protein LOC119614503 n=1 Tax=Lucilia sericata TaxID=13632 RepID=UPI0018A7F575|nr:uncharacterized protein LOC119614503 [Lucilia sericata]
MLLKLKVLIFIIWSYTFFEYTNAIDISDATSLFSKNILKCYQCSTLEDDDCKNSTLVLKNISFIKECKPDATGCVKQFVKKSNGRNATFYECYYDDISSLYTDFGCDGIARTRQYDEAQCYKCKGNLCNNSNRLTLSIHGVMFFTFLVFVIVTFLSRV